MTNKEAAELLNSNPVYLSYWARRNGVGKNGAAYEWTQEDVERFRAQSRLTPDDKLRQQPQERPQERPQVEPADEEREEVSAEEPAAEAQAEAAEEWAGEAAKAGGGCLDEVERIAFECMAKVRKLTDDGQERKAAFERIGRRMFRRAGLEVYGAQRQFGCADGCRSCCEERADEYPRKIAAKIKKPLTIGRGRFMIDFEVRFEEE